MKTLISFALLIPLYQFGDIIAFPRVKKCSCQKSPYKHYAIYVGSVDIPGKALDQDIFHRTGKTKFTATCQFGKLSDEPHHHRENYLDVFTDLSVGNHAEILARIKFSLNNCTKYSLLKSNCEHLATYVRYGKDVSEQPGTVFGRVWRWFRKPIYPIGPDYVDVSCTNVCRHRLKQMFVKSEQLVSDPSCPRLK